MKTAALIAPLAGLAALSAAPAEAASVAALMDGNRIAIVDTAAYKAGEAMTVTGVDGTLVGIDVRPADGMLYGLASDGTVVTIDVDSGQATVKSKLSTMLPEGSAATVDFNPVADRLRIIGSDGTNLRANVDDGKVTTDGKLAFAEADMHKGETPNIVAGAYTNSVAGAKETALYDIDATIGGLIKQAPPNDGVLNAVGKLGVTADRYAFDIRPGEGAGEGWLMAGDTLYAVDLETGAATALGKVAGASGPVLDIAVLPET
ncbi:DUF4394 domain-containing protein [Chthonobacter rhizosphaerae]|uniref:DUF4394 domain-containing protein n=1 Tax=Chthonobacter rhizosphaerae TaxID=2735553 RepID=UPI0015EFC4E8|nr:DUF4394 domain-containing protein [Chthonobacter rhizosphaerae]